MINTIRESGYIEAKWARDSAANTEADVAAEADYDTQDTQDEDDDNMPETEPIIEKIENKKTCHLELNNENCLKIICQ